MALLLVVPGLAGRRADLDQGLFIGSGEAATTHDLTVGVLMIQFVPSRLPFTGYYLSSIICCS